MRRAVLRRLASRRAWLGAVIVALVVASALMLACGSSGAPPLFTGNGGESADAGASGGSGNGNGNGNGNGGGLNEGGLLGSGGGGFASGPGCSDASTLVYVLSEENDLYSFDPPARAFTKIGTLDCSAPGLTPNSMAVSRDAVAWVNYASPDNTHGAIFKVSTTDATCQPTQVTLGPAWTRLGMGFSTDTATGTSETLFVAATGATQTIPSGAPTSQGLASLDLGTQLLLPIGPFSGALAGQDAELTGTGDGRLFGFFTTSPVQIAQIDKASGATSNVVPLATVEVPRAWAFSFWGGDFYLYTDPGTATRTTNVTHYSPLTGTADTAYMTNIGFIIVGAGVSTCAPTSPPLQ